jgi:hypothetical protein
MSTQEKARQQAAEQRQHEKNRQQSLLERSEAEIAAGDGVEIQAETRESLAKQRQSEQHRQQSLQLRSEAEIAPTQADNPASELE